MAKILIVDDSTVMRKNLYSIFTKNGHEVVGEAVDGKQALLLYSELKPDLVTMDITMPKMNGVDAVTHIMNKNKNAKIIMISALNQKQMVFEALKSGAKHYIIKPIEASKLLGIINEVLKDTEKLVEKISETESKHVITESKQGFKIENIAGKFVFYFNENLSIEDYAKLDTAIKGLLFISPLNVIFDFSNLGEITYEIFSPIINLGTSIKKAGGKLEFVTNSENLINMINEVDR
jgi:two-component system chemotaxis response regulator CheY